MEDQDDITFKHLRILLPLELSRNLFDRLFALILRM